MTNPYNVYSDNRAYFGWFKAVRDIREIAMELTDGKTIDLDKFMEATDVDNDRFGYLLYEM